MVREKILIKCEKCGSTNVLDEKHEEVKVVTLSMDEYIEKNRAKSMPCYFGQIQPIMGTSHMEKRVLRCLDCGYTRLYDCVVYT